MNKPVAERYYLKTMTFPCVFYQNHVYVVMCVLKTVIVDHVIHYKVVLIFHTYIHKLKYFLYVNNNKNLTVPGLGMFSYPLVKFLLIQLKKNPFVILKTRVTSALLFVEYMEKLSDYFISVFLAASYPMFSRGSCVQNRIVEVVQYRVNGTNGLSNPSDWFGSLLAPRPLIASLHILFKCSICKSAGIFLPVKPRVLIK